MKRLPLPVLALGAGVLLLILIGGVIAYRVNSGDPQGAPAPQQGQPAAQDPGAPDGGNEDPESNLTPREGEPEPLREGRLDTPNDYLGLYGRGQLTVLRYEWSDAGDIAPAAGKKYLNLQIQLKSTQDVVLAKPIQFSVRSAGKDGAGGNEDLLPTIGSGKDDQLAYEMLRPPDAGTFWVSFEAPQSAAVFYFADEGINTLLAIPIPAS